MSAVIVFIIFVICLVIAIPVSISLGIVSVLPGAFDASFPASGQFVVRSMLGGIDSFPLLAVPMFVLSGIVMAKGGISKKLFDVFAFFLGKRTAGVPCAVIVTCLFYGAISGSAPATVAAVGSMTIPILTKLGYDKAFSTAMVAVSGGLGKMRSCCSLFIRMRKYPGQSSRLWRMEIFRKKRNSGLKLWAASQRQESDMPWNWRGRWNSVSGRGH